MGSCNCSMFYCALLCVHSSIAIISLGKREIIALFCLSVVWHFLTMPRVCLQFVIVVFPDHTHYFRWFLVSQLRIHKMKFIFVLENSEDNDAHFIVVEVLIYGFPV